MNRKQENTERLRSYVSTQTVIEIWWLNVKEKRTHPHPHTHTNTHTHIRSNNGMSQCRSNAVVHCSTPGGAQTCWCNQWWISQVFSSLPSVFSPLGCQPLPQPPLPSFLPQLLPSSPLFCRFCRSHFIGDEEKRNLRYISHSHHLIILFNYQAFSALLFGDFIFLLLLCRLNLSRDRISLWNKHFSLHENQWFNVNIYD